MRQRLSLILLSMSLVGGALMPVQPAMADAITDAQNKQNQLSATIARDKAALAAVQGQEAQTQARMVLLSDQITLAEANLANQNAKLDELLGEIDKAQRDLAAKRIEEAQRQAVLNNRMRGLYKENGSTTFMDALFSARTFSELMDRFIVMRDITRSDELLLQQIQQDKAAIEALSAQLVQKRDDQAATVKGIRDQTNALQGQYLELSVLKAQLATEATSIQDQQRQAQAALTTVGAEIAALQAARSRAHSSGKFAWPEPSVQGPITQGFGCTDLGGEPPPPSGYTCHPMGSCYANSGCFHYGIDIAGPYGTEIDAADGGIAYTYPGSQGYGNYIIIVHANGFSSLYGHMPPPSAGGFAVSNGQSVVKGQKIGYEGSSGFSTGAHLHFEIRLNNQPVNPCNYVGC